MTTTETRVYYRQSMRGDGSAVVILRGPGAAGRVQAIRVDTVSCLDCRKSKGGRTAVTIHTRDGHVEAVLERGAVEQLWAAVFSVPIPEDDED